MENGYFAGPPTVRCRGHAPRRNILPIRTGYVKRHRPPNCHCEALLRPKVAISEGTAVLHHAIADRTHLVGGGVLTPRRVKLPYSPELGCYQYGPARLPRRFALAMTHQDGVVVQCTSALARLNYPMQRSNPVKDAASMEQQSRHGYAVSAATDVIGAYHFNGGCYTN